jgi:hypothetical protein
MSKKRQRIADAGSDDLYQITQIAMVLTCRHGSAGPSAVDWQSRDTKARNQQQEP